MEILDVPRDAEPCRDPTARHEGDASPQDNVFRFLQQAGRLFLEYNMRSALLNRRLCEAAAALGEQVQTLVGYRQLTLYTASGRSINIQVPEFRINIAISVGVMGIVDEVCAGRLSAYDAAVLLDDVERAAERHDRWILVTLFAFAAAALAVLLAADIPAIIVIGIASAAGLLARQELAKRHVSLFALPFAAAFIGSLAGGLLIRLGATTTPGICLIVPALMLVPGPHFINSLYDLAENNMTSGLGRLALAMGIMFAAAMGIFFGAWLMLGMTTVPPWAGTATQLPLWADVLMAGVAACGFGAVYNAPWRVLWTSIVCGMVGHGIRYLCIATGVGMAMSTFAGCLAIGVAAAHFAQRLRVPFAAVAFAGAVPMMPGVLMFQSLGGAMELAFAGSHAPQLLIASTFSQILTSGFVVGAMGLGLMLGAGVGTVAAQVLGDWQKRWRLVKVRG